MDDKINEYQEAFNNGNLLQAIHDRTIGHWDDLDAQVEELIGLHNSQKIDLIDCFSTLKNIENGAPDFFSTRHIIEKALPKLIAPIDAVMNCVLALVEEAGQDMAAGMILPPFVDFCAAQASRPKEALSLFRENPDRYTNLLPQIVSAGARSDPDYFVGEAIQLCKNERLDIRRVAIFSLGLIGYSKIDGSYQDRVLGCFETFVVLEEDDQALGRLTQSAFSIYKETRLSADRTTNIIEKALSKGGDYTLHTAAILFGSEVDIIPEILLDLILSNLAHVKPINKGTIDQIDVGLMRLLGRSEKDKAVNLLEIILLSNPETITLDVFDSTMHELYKNQGQVLNRLLTRWFLRGDKVLGEGINSIVELALDKNFQLGIVPSEFDTSDPMCFIFLARKSIGYLFPAPVTAASVIISLIEFAPNDETIQELIKLLFDPLSINYPGMVLDYLNKLENGSERVKDSIKKVLGYFDDYIKNIHAARNIPELYPSQDQRESFNRHFSRLMSDAMNKAQQDSVLLSLVSKSVLLYGRKSIDYVYSANGQSNRMEIPLKSHSMNMEFPRLGIIDPFGLDYVLRIFRAERRIV